MFNVDRWEIYTRQNLSRALPGSRTIGTWDLYGLTADWNYCTPKQIRRMKKKARKGDTSIGMY